MVGLGDNVSREVLDSYTEMLDYSFNQRDSSSHAQLNREYNKRMYSNLLRLDSIKNKSSLLAYNSTKASEQLKKAQVKEKETLWLYTLLLVAIVVSFGGWMYYRKTRQAKAVKRINGNLDLVKEICDEIAEETAKVNTIHNTKYDQVPDDSTSELSETETKS